MGSFLVKLLTDPGDFQFYAGNSEGQLGSVSEPTSFGQKSIPFGKDRPGGGSSKQPYITKPLINNTQNPAFYSDFLIRGGILAPLAAAQDTLRLTKYFTDLNNPTGILFATKQNILSRVGVKTEAVRPNAAYLGGVLNEGVYLPTSTIAQALVGFTGTTLNKQGIDPTGLIPFLSIEKYQEAVYKKNQIQVAGTSIPKSVQRKVDKINQNIIKTNDNLIQTQKDLAAQTAYSPSQPSSNIIDRASINAISNKFNKLKQQQFEFDVKWDQIKEGRLKKRVSNLEDGLDDLQNQLTDTLQNRLLKLWNKFGLNPSNESPISNSSTLLSYGGGPGSALGFSKTKIKFATSNDGETPLRTGYVMVDPYAGIGYLNYSPGNPIVYGLDPIFDGKQLYSSVYRQYQKKNPSVTEEQYFGVPTYFNDVLAGGYDGALTIQPWDIKPSNNSTLSEQQLAAQELNPNSETLEDFRTLLEPLTKENSTFLSPTSNYPQDFEKRFNLTGGTGLSAGHRRRNRSNPALGSLVNDSSVSQPLDSVTAYPIYKSEYKNGSRYGQYGQKGLEELNDIVEFSIAILNNDDQNKPEQGITGLSYRKYMHFRAFIDNISDSYDAEWNAIKYMGRGEKFYKYGGYDRKMSLGFTVVAQSKDELNVMYDKLNFLASSLAPEYLDSLTSGYMCGNIAYITLGDYIYDQPGIITSLTYDIPEESPWEINRDTTFVSGSAVSGTARQLPHMIKVTLNFTPIQKFRPSKQTWSNDFTIQGEGIATSTVLADPGNQRFIDPNNPYNGKNTNAGVNEARIQLQSQIQINQIPQSPVSVDVVSGNQGEVLVQ